MSAPEYVELLDREIQNTSSSSITVAADVLATDAWHELVDATQLGYREHGMIVGRHIADNRLIRSKILEGFAREVDEDTNETMEAAFPKPLFPFGVIKGMALKLRQDVAIHTHPMTPDVDHIRTTIISDADIACFAISKYNAMVMLDRGGAHLLARTRKSVRPNIPAPNIVKSAIHEVKAENGGSLDVAVKVARRLSLHGLGYYYTPELSQVGENVEFQNLRQ